jgi:hypothetical protein
MLRSALIVRKMSTSPRMTIAQGMLKIQALSNASSQEALAAAVTHTPTIDTTKLPDEIAHLDTYLTSTIGVKQAPFVPNPDAWQNMPLWKYVITEYWRPMNRWVFIVGPM